MYSNPCIKWALFSRSRALQQLAFRLINPESSPFIPSDSSNSIIACGDMSFDPEYRMPPGVYRLREKHAGLMRLRRKIWQRLCKLIFSPRFLSHRIDTPYVELLTKTSKNKKPKFLSEHYRTRIDIDVDYSSVNSRFAYPFKKIESFLKEKDIVWANLETPISDSPRTYGFFISDPRYANAMKDAGITLVCLANNHIFDAGEVGFLDTIEHLEQMGIPYTGAGNNFEHARLGRLIKLNGKKIGFLSYTQYCNTNYASIAAEYSGILPLDPEIIVEDINIVKKSADYVLVSLHWGIINQHSIHRKQIEIAHLLIDAGADIIVGHSPHIPHGIEIYRGKPILYSLGNFIFPYNRTEWSDNFLAEIIINKKGVEGVMLHPISGQGKDLFQPEILKGERADSLLYELQIKSAIFKTGIAIQNHIGYINLINHL